MSTRMSVPANTDTEMDTDLSTNDISLAKKEPQVKKKIQSHKVSHKKRKEKIDQDLLQSLYQKERDLLQF